MIKVITSKRYAAMLDEIENLRRQVIEENRAKYAALRRLAELKKAEQDKAKRNGKRKRKNDNGKTNN